MHWIFYFLISAGVFAIIANKALSEVANEEAKIVQEEETDR
ncbi:hypothetical protein [Listeria ilorinensis]|nr:hypothetical protein [Listeria ilorinensis]